MLVWLHFFADFILQSDKVALNKSKDPWILLWHVILYSLPFWFFCGWRFAAVNAGLHFVVDLASSNVTSILWQKEKRHWFFVVIGLDQALHLTCLILTEGLILWR